MGSPPIAAPKQRLPTSPVYVLPLVLILLVVGKLFRMKLDAAEEEVQENVRTAADSFLAAMSRGDVAGAERNTTGLPTGDVARARAEVPHVWGRGWTTGEVHRPSVTGEATTLVGYLSGRDARVREYRMTLTYENAWKIREFATGEAPLLPLPRILEAPEAVPILGLRIVKTGEKGEHWWLRAEIEVVAPVMETGARFWKYGVSYFARILDPSGTQTAAGGCTCTWEDEPATKGRKTLAYDFAVEKARGPGKYRITLVVEDRHSHASTRDLEVELP